MSSPRVIVQIAIVGAQILGRALAAAGRQAVQNAKQRPGGAEEAAGVRNADAITQQHRLTIDEAHLILNAKRGDPLPNILKNYEHLFKANSPPEAPTAEATAAAGRRAAQTRFHSHYIQSKIVRARERIEAEHLIEQEAENAKRTGETAAKPEDSSTPPPPTPPPASS